MKAAIEQKVNNSVESHKKEVNFTVESQINIVGTDLKYCRMDTAKKILTVITQKILQVAITKRQL